MGRVLSCLLGAVLVTSMARAAHWDISVDARPVSSNGRESFLQNGLGVFRYGDDKSGLRLGRARIEVSQQLGEVASFRLDASSWGDDDKNPIDLTEAYFELRPYPRAGYRARVKAGAFYAPVSLENRAAGWASPYTLSSSALNTWIAEELRTIGLEAQLDWLGTHLGKSFDLGVTAGVFGWNDPAGTLVASHGFALHDRQTTLFGRVGRPGGAVLDQRELFHEIDGRAGIYCGLEARYLDRVVARALHYDNRADPTAFDVAVDDFAWETRFDSAGLRVEGSNGWGFIVQWLEGETYIAPRGRRLGWPFDARFVLLSKRFGQHSLSARWDDFYVGSPRGDLSQAGHAWTAGYVFERDEHWRFMVEWIRARTDNEARLVIGEAPLATESKLELAIRYAFGAS